jgi:hypothetical protein
MRWTTWRAIPKKIISMSQTTWRAISARPYLVRRAAEHLVGENVAVNSVGQKVLDVVPGT